MSIEAAHYENPELWNPDRYIADHAELDRFDACIGAIPAEAATLLDVGTGNGAFLRLLEERRPALRLQGLERSAAAIERKICQAPIQAGSADSLPYADGAFDVVSALEVIEHLPFGVYEPALAELARVARLGVLISVPFREYRLRVRCPYCACDFNPHYHMRRFDERTLRGLVPGFTLEQLHTVSVPDFPLGGLVKPVYRRVRQWLGFFPGHAICPQCGYTRRGGSEAAAGAPDTASSTERAERLGRSARGLLPRVRRPVWAVAFYRPERTTARP